MNESECYSLKYGECRCCYTRGNHRELMKEYEWNGTREVYFKIFLECFNVFLCTNTGKSNLICTSCVLRLRDALSFKKMVLEAERSLINCQMKQEDPITDPIDPISSSSTLELEVKKEPKVNSDCESSGTDHNDDISDDEPLSEYKEPARIKKYNPSTYAKTVRENFAQAMRTKCKFSKSRESYAETVRATFCKLKNNNRAEKLAYIYNTTLIIENSNVTPFKAKHQNGFPCFYCGILLFDLPTMKEHQKKHTKADLKTVLHTIGAESFIVYVDITDLKCTICNENIANLTELKLHLIKKHKKKIPDCPDRIIPFKLTPNKIECQVCECKFETFGAIERHMNVHFRNYVCEECGAGFATKTRFKVHAKQHHQGRYECETCKKVYSTPIKLKNHVDVVHRMLKRFKCVKCDERFTEYFKRQQHMVNKHGCAKLEYRCNVCEKVFDRKYLLSTHMKRDHLEQRDYQCEMCSYTCFSNNELKYHMIKHNGSRIFECSVCNKSYARKKTLREHMRIHNNDRRYACQACGQAFVQNCSLKGHIKTHHPELLMQ